MHPVKGYKYNESKDKVDLSSFTETLNAHGKRRQSPPEWPKNKPL